MNVKYVVILMPEGRPLRSFAKVEQAAEYLMKHTLEESPAAWGDRISQTFRIAELEG